MKMPFKRNLQYSIMLHIGKINKEDSVPEQTIWKLKKMLWLCNSMYSHGTIINTIYSTVIGKDLMKK